MDGDLTYTTYPRIRYVVGIDPAKRENGFCIAIFDKVENSMYFKMFESLLNYISWLTYERPENAVYIIENSSLQNYVWMKGSVTKDKVYKALCVGKNMSASQYTYEATLAIAGKDKVKHISPKQKGLTMTVDQFAYATHGITLINYKGNQNEHDKRAAGMCALKNFAFLRDGK